MEKFLKDYVKMIAENNEKDLTKDQLQTIVGNLMEDEEIWDLLDSYIYNYLEDIEEE